MEQSQYQILTSPATRLKVSTTQAGQGAMYGKQNIFDGKEETSWYSATGKSQYVCVFFEEDISVEEIDISFCGGFGPKVCYIYTIIKQELEVAYSENDEFDNKKPVFTSPINAIPIEDSNKPITLPIQIAKCKTIKLGMKQFYDPYGRVIVYDLKIKGKRSKV